MSRLGRFSVTSVFQVHAISSSFSSVVVPPSSSSSSVFKKHSILPSTMHPAKLIHSSYPVFAGHNRWSKIFRKKAVADHDRSIRIAKYVNRISSAIELGGSADPDLNSRLASLILQAKSAGLSKSQIMPLLKPGTSKQAQKDHVIYEAKAQAGYLILIEVITNTKSRVKGDLKVALARKRCTLGESGSALFNFDHKGIVRVSCNELHSSKTDPFELAIEVGAEDVTTDTSGSNPSHKTGINTDDALELDSNTLEPDSNTLESDNNTLELDSEDDECYQFMCEPRDLTSVANAIEKKSFTIVTASLDYIPKRVVKLKADDFEKAVNLKKKLGQMDCVMEVYDNIVLDEQETELTE